MTDYIDVPVEHQGHAHKWWDQDNVSPRPVDEIKMVRFLPLSSEILRLNAHCYWCGKLIEDKDKVYALAFHYDLPPRRYHFDCIEDYPEKYWNKKKREGWLFDEEQERLRAEVCREIRDRHPGRFKKDTRNKKG